MSKNGQIASGCFNVKIEGQPAARKSDLTDHAGIIVSGCPTVKIGNVTLLAARQGDFFTCPDADVSAHLAGMITGPCALHVKIGGQPAARLTDPTLCSGVALALGGTGMGNEGSDGNGDASECAKLWDKYHKEAEAIIAPGDHNHRVRNKIISGAYADLYLRNPEFQWAGLAGYASKQVGCAMDHAEKMKGIFKAAAGVAGGAIVVAPPTVLPAAAAAGGAAAGAKMADYTYEMLGKGNRNLFLDIYPLHRFFEDHGYEKMAGCAGARTPPMTAAALDGFKAIHEARRTGDKGRLKDSVVSLAQHEQIAVLQKEIYNDFAMRRILDANETGLPGTSPADVVMNSGCSDPTGGKQTIKFRNGTREDLYSVPERMDWIINDIGGNYFGFEGTPRHTNDMEEIRRQGQTAGGVFSPKGATKP